MTGRRYVVAGLAHARAAWFGDVGRWSTTARIPVEFLRCLRTEELLALLDGQVPLSATLIDLGAPGVDRDLLADVRATGAAVLVVRSPGTGSPPGTVDAELPSGFGPDELIAALEEHATPLGVDDRAPAPQTTAPDRFRGRLVVCCGPGGTGASVTAMAVAQGIAADPRRHRLVALADLARHGDQAVLHDAGDIAPGLPELVEAHRGGDPEPEQIRRLLHVVPDRGYDLLLGMRRHRDWTALRPRAVGAAIDGLLATYALVVADIDHDLEGELETGSVDVEERNALSRAAVARADLVLTVGTSGTKGIHAVARTLRHLIDHDLPPDRLVPVLVGVGRNPATRSAAARSLVGLAGAPIASPVFVPHHGRVEASIRDGRPLPAALAQKVAGSALALLDVLPERRHDADGPVPVVAGRLGAAGSGEDPW
jgi:hypothetical protein